MSKKKRTFTVVKYDAPVVTVTHDYKRACFVCGAKPTVPETGMCGPCTFGEADTADGNW